MSGNNDEEYNDFANEDEEIKEEIGSDNDDQLQCTYDKFLMESVALNNNNGNSNQVQAMLRNQMKNIIGEIKQQKIENIKNTNNRRQQILKDLTEKFNIFDDKTEKKEDDNTICNIETNEPTTLNETKQNRENTLIASLKESQDKLYNINIEEFIKDNTKIENPIVNQNETVDNPYVNHSNNNSFNNKSLHGNPYLQQRIQENYNRFLMNSQKNSNQVTGRFKANENGNVNENKDQRLILVDSCTDEQERQIKQQKIERLRMKKLKELEEKNKNLRKKSTSKPTIHNNVSNNNNISNANSSKSRIAINARPATAKSNCTITSKNSVSKIRPNTSKANYSNMTSNSSGINDSNMSRVPIKIKRAECIIANKKVKNVKYSKMSNKNAIKKAIKEVCLAGPHYKDSREKILSIIDSCESENYIILFKGDYGFYLHGVYTYDSQNNQIELLTCINDAPNFIDSSMVDKYYRYNISQKQFKELGGNKEFSVIVDGIILRANI